MGQPESQRSAKGGRGRTGGREEWEEEQKSKYWRGSAGELPGTWAVPFPIQPFPLTPFPSHLSLTELPTWMCAHIPGCTHQRMVQPGTPRAWMVTNTIVPPAGVWLTGRADAGSWEFPGCSSALSCPWGAPISSWRLPEMRPQLQLHRKAQLQAHNSTQGTEGSHPHPARPRGLLYCLNKRSQGVLRH